MPISTLPNTPISMLLQAYRPLQRRILLTYNLCCKLWSRNT